uniref:FERM domain-containing protein 8 n=1 Tax=Ascaris suum TaxID=6253 RepID=F1L175_ASCSU
MSSTVFDDITVPLLHHPKELEATVESSNSTSIIDEGSIRDRKIEVQRPIALSIALDITTSKTNTLAHRRNRSVDLGHTKESELLEYSEWSPQKIDQHTMINASKVLSPSLSNSTIHMNRSTNRKLSESRGVKLPDITIKSSSTKSQSSNRIAQKSKRKQVSYSDQQQAGTSQEHSDQTTPNSPPLTSSPVGYTLRHPGPLTVDPSAKAAPQSATPPLAQLNDAIDITVFLADQRGYKFALVGGKVSTASDLIYLMADRLGIDTAILQETCALWMISDLLEVQLKPHHIPYEIRRSWTVLLKRFTQAELDEIVADEPLIVLKRNVQLSIEREIELEDDYESLTEILYVGAKKEVLAGRYLCDLETSMRLAALQMAIELGPYDPLEHSADFIR